MPHAGAHATQFGSVYAGYPTTTYPDDVGLYVGDACEGSVAGTEQVVGPNQNEVRASAGRPEGIHEENHKPRKESLCIHVRTTLVPAPHPWRFIQDGTMNRVAPFEPNRSFVLVFRN